MALEFQRVSTGVMWSLSALDKLKSARVAGARGRLRHGVRRRERGRDEGSAARGARWPWGLKGSTGINESSKDQRGSTGERSQWPIGDINIIRSFLRFLIKMEFGDVKWA